MMRCEQCHISYTGQLDACPLCGSSLSGNPTPSPFPFITLIKKSKQVRRWLLMITVACCVLSLILGIWTHISALTMVVICVAILLNYFFLRNMLLHASDSLRLIERYFLILVALAYLWFFATGQSAVIVSVIPILCLVALLSNSVLVLVFRNAFVQSYAKYLIGNVILGVIPLVFFFANQTWWPWLACASAAASVILLAVMLIFTHRQTTSEMRKLFNA